jgi:thiopeptide-type bacteriocin biosynthesis protein
MGDGAGPAFAASGFVVLRTPLLAFDELLALGAGLAAVATVRGAPADLDAALAADRARLVGRLRELAARPEVREAIQLASPSLDESLAMWLERPDADRGPKVVRALFRYVARMAARATPFGLFAGVSVGRVAADTRLRLGPRATARKHARLDVAYVAALAGALGQHPALGPHLVPAPSVTDDDALAWLIAALRRHAGAPGAGAVPELADWIAELETAARALAALAAEPPGSEPATWRSVAGALAGLPERVAHAATLAGATSGSAAATGDRRARVLDRVARADAKLFEVLARGLEARAARERLAHVVQVDLIKDSPAATLGPAVLDEMLRGAELLRRIVPASDPLAAFTAAFTARHGDEQVPLLEAVDEDHGIPVPPAAGPAAREPLLRGLDFAGEQPALPFGPREAHLLERLQDTLRAVCPGDPACLELDADDIARLAADPRRPLPDAFAVLASLAADSEEALATGRFRVHLACVLGPSGATLLGRFCHGDPGLAAHVAAQLRAEEALRPDAIHAEVAFLPDGRDGNVARRPALRAHHIAVGGHAAGSPDGRIDPTDLRLSLVDGRLILRSHRLGREVLPRLMSAHNYKDPRHPAVYRLLGALQHQGTTGPLAFSWGALESAPMLPRVTSRRLVLSRARWRLGRARLAALARLDGAARFAAVQRLRDQLALPRWVELVDHDHELPLDLDNPLAVDELVALGRARDAAVVVELFPPPDALVARGPEGRYTHELVVPFVCRAAPPARPTPPPLPRDFPRRLLPGSSWLYCKLYTTPSAADDLLRAVVRPVIAAAKAAGAARRWFFLRYADPDFHLRLRVHGAPDALLGTVLPALHAAAAPAVAAGHIARLQLDTYEREVDRYGGPDGIDLAERLFHADSEAALAWIADHSATADETARWRLALRGIDQLLDDLGLALVDKDHLTATLRDDLQRRLRAETPLLRAIGDRFRTERPALERLLDRAGDATHPLAPALALFARRSAAVRPIVDELRHRERAGRLTRPIAQQASSYVHLFANRVARAHPVEQELMLYSFLARLYRTRLARSDGA